MRIPTRDTEVRGCYKRFAQNTGDVDWVLRRVRQKKVSTVFMLIIATSVESAKICVETPGVAWMGICCDGDPQTMYPGCEES